MKFATALAVIAVTSAAAVYVHQRRVPVYTHAANFSAHSDPTVELPSLFVPVTRRPSWEDPVAVLVALGGLALAVGIVVVGRSTQTV